MATFSRPDWLLKIRGTRVVPRGRKPQKVPRVLVRIEYDSSSYRETLPSSWMISQLMMKEGRKGESVERENRGLCVCVWRGDIFARKGTRRWHVVGGNWCHWATWLARVLAAGYGHLRSTFVCIFRRMDRFQNLGSLGNNAEYPRANRRFALFLNHVSLCDLIISTPFAGICLQSFRTKFVKIRLDSKRVFESLEIDERSLERWQV